MTSRTTLNLQPRDTLGKKVKRLRAADIIPVHLYGAGIASRSLQCGAPDLTKLMAQASGNIPISITVEGEQEEYLAFVREVQREPIRGNLLHVDFLRAEATRRVSAEVPLLLVGDSLAARQVSGTVVQQLRSLTVEALPLEMPQNFEVDLSVLTEPNAIIRAGDIPLPPGATLLSDADGVVARIEVARAEEARPEEIADEAVSTEVPTEVPEDGDKG